MSAVYGTRNMLQIRDEVFAELDEPKTSMELVEIFKGKIPPPYIRRALGLLAERGLIFRKSNRYKWSKI